MNMMTRLACALALALLPSAAFAQGIQIDPAQSGVVRQSGIAYGERGSPAISVTTATPLPIAAPATITASANFTTPAGTTAYASGDLIANSATAGTVTPLSFTACRANAGSGMIRRVRAKTTDTGFAGGAITIAFYKTSPTVTNGDNGAWLSTESNYLGSVPVTLDKHFSDAEKGVGVPATGSEINFDCATGSTTIYGLIIAGGAITPQGAKVHTVVAEILAN